MSLPDLIVRAAAKTLPPAMRDRYREEWQADVADAAEVGLRPASVALGAVFFTLTLSRSSPEVMGISVPAIAARHVMRAITFLGIAAVLAFSSLVVGDAQSDARDTSPLVSSFVAAIGWLWPKLAATSAIVSLYFLWKAALLSSALLRVAAAVATLGIAMVVIPMFLPAMFPAWMTVAAAVMLFAAGVVTLVSWGSAIDLQRTPAETAAPRVRPAPRRWSTRTILLVALAGVLALSFAAFFVPVLAAFLAAALAVVGVIVFWRVRAEAVLPHGIRAARRRVRVAVVISGLVLLTLIAFATVEMAWLGPIWMAPGYSIGEILAALGAEATSGLVMIAIWTGFWTLVTLGLVVFGWIRAERTRVRTMVALALTIAATAVFFVFAASFSIGNAISDTLPPMAGGISEYGRLVYIIGQVSLMAAIVLWAWPRPLRMPQPRTSEPAAAPA